MTGADVKAIRNALSEATGRRVSQYDLGIILGLSVDNAARLVRKWEEEEASGPAAMALRYLSQGLPGYRGELREWSYQHEFHASAARGLQVLHRQWWPRFVARVEGGTG